MSSTPSQPDADFEKSDLIGGRYQIKQKLGKGTFGEVFLADDLKFNPPRAVALKILHSKFLDEPGVRADIEREASILARFSHANILRVIDFDISENQAYIVTELAENGSLARKIRPDPNKPPVRMSLDEVGWYLEQLTDALDEAHQAGLIHRDLKPLNILLNKRGRPLIADFGLATAVSSSQSSVLVDAKTSGTPPYMAPEQWMGHAGRASDIYALGVITYQLITGELPYQGNHFELMGQHLNAPIPRLSDRAPGLPYPPALDNVIAGVLAKDPKQRTRSALDFYRNFRNALMPFSSPSGSFESFPSYPGGKVGSGQPAYSEQPGPVNGSGSTPSGSNPSNPPGALNAPITGAYQSNSTAGNRPGSQNPLEGPFSPFAAIPPGPINQGGDNRYNGSTVGAIPPNYPPENPPPSGLSQTGQTGVNQAGLNAPITKQPASKRTPLFIGLGIVSAIIIVGAVVAGILLLNSNSPGNTPTQVNGSAASPTGAPTADTTGAAASDTPSPDTAAAGTAEPTTTEPATTAVATGQSVIARQGSLRKVTISPAFVQSAIRATTSNNSSNTTLQVFSSSETPDKVKTELDNGLAGENYTYAVPEPHKSVPSEFYGGYTKEGSPDLVYIIVDVNDLPAVLKNGGVDDSSIQKLVNDTKGQKSVIFSFEGDGLVTAAFEPEATQTPAPGVTAAGTGNSTQGAQAGIPAYNGATSYTLPDTISNQVLSSLGGTSAKNVHLEAFKVVAQDNEIQKYFASYLKQAGWTDASSSMPADTAKGYRDAGILAVGPYTKGQDIVLILVGKGQYASELTGVAGNENVYLVIKATS